ncbi:DUF429 domain-containing protein [Alienimonas chondri]|uniref:DUF429 domain-containing protein n=1 Tax=Alienimonas chondri TaxID=2681879 RepID=A0ABX1VD63_9PLAN|nr:DUF429 domain-containing protein [Alienimonas chondri]NNJ25639.1 hypothetical protein [Alienimonas chondri]
MTVTLIGYDCATQSKKAGLARGTWDGGAVSVEEALVGAKDVAGVLRGWLDDRPEGQPAVLAIDAPLGWPAPMGIALATHAAGDPLPHVANRMFRRATDDFVHRTIGKRSLDVGADRIARTAACALAIVGALRADRRLPLLLEPGPPAGAGVIEVYPAATLKSRGLPTRGYKSKERATAVPARTALLDRLAEEARLPVDRGSMIASDDAFDAAVCVLAAGDFVAGRVHRPPVDLDVETLRREGWIWFGPTV